MTTSAIILAAGVGRRLRGGHGAPKALLQFGGKSLLQRHVEALHANGIEDISITVGYEAGAIRTELARIGAADVRFVNNPDYRQGSVVSLWVQRERLRSGHPVVLMDADVLCDARMIRRLVDAGRDAVLLVDRELEPGDEPVKVCFRGDRIVDFRKVPDRAHDWHGESVGFFRFSPRMSAALAERCDAYVRGGRTDLEYEEAIRQLVLAYPERFTAVDVTDLPWTEIDFDADVVRAGREVLPELTP